MVALVNFTTHLTPIMYSATNASADCSLQSHDNKLHALRACRMH